MLMAWIITPVLLAALAYGTGGLIELATGRSLAGLRLPVGLAALAIVTSGLFLIGADAPLVVLIATAVGLGGLMWFSWKSERGVRSWSDVIWTGLTGVLAYVLLLLPLISLGRTGILGYVLNNDPSAHLSVVELLQRSGMHFYAEPASSLESVSGILNNSYPIGSHGLVVLASQYGGDPFDLWTPLIAMAGAAAALTVRRLLLEFEFSAAWCSLGAVTVACSFLPLSFVMQGSYKETLLAMLVLLAACSAVVAREADFAPRSLIPFCVAGGGALAVFGPGAAAWIVPIGFAMLLLALKDPAEGTSRAKTLGGFAIVGAGALILLLPQLINSIGFATDADAQQSASELGNLAQPLPWAESLGIWFNGDFRYDPFSLVTVNFLLIGLAAGMVLFGIRAAWRGKRLGVSLALGAALLAAAWLHLRYPPYLEAKGILVLGFAAATMAVVGVASFAERVPVGTFAVAAALLLGVALSYALVYRDVWPTPEARFAELADFNDQLRGEDVLVNEREPYAMYLLKDVDAGEYWSNWVPFGPLPLTGAKVPKMPHTPDTDDYYSDFITSRDWILDRKHPGSRPPGNYALKQETKHYRLWRRTGPAPAQHIALGVGRVGGAELLKCEKQPIKDLIKNHPRAKVRLALAKPPVVVGSNAQTSGVEDGPQRGILRSVESGAKIYGPAHFDLPGEKYESYVQGSFGPGFRLNVNGNPLGDIQDDLGTQDGWQPGETFVADRNYAFGLNGLSQSLLRAGSARDDLIGATAFVPTSRDQLIVTTAAKMAKYCGRNIDWVERV